MDVSTVGLRGTLKSPPSSTIPSRNVKRRSDTFLKKEVWCSFGQYTFASVTGLEAYLPLTNMYLPSGSIIVSKIWKSACLEMRIDTPFVLESGFVECNAHLYT